MELQRCFGKSNSEIKTGLECLDITNKPLLNVLVTDGGDALGDVSQ